MINPAAADRALAAQRGVALVMLFLVGTINFVDRQLLSVLVEPIRAELHLTDTQFGLLTGLAFALFYAGMGVPVAYLADRWNRVRLIAAACLVWSAFTALTGQVSSFVQLALIRFGVGAGEAGGTAPSLSLVSDLFPPHRRPFAVALFQLNGPFGVFVGSAFGAWAAVHLGWRGAFLVMGLAGVVIAPLLVWAVREPARGQMDAAGSAVSNVPLRETLAMFVRSPSLRLVLLGNGLSAFVSYGILNWVPAFLMRTQHMPLPAMGQWFGPAAGLTFGIGIFGSGWLVSRLASRDPRAYGYVPALASLAIAQSPAKPTPSERVALWPGKAPNGDGTFEDSAKELEVFLPSGDKANGAAIVLCPGGGYIRHVLALCGGNVTRAALLAGVPPPSQRGPGVDAGAVAVVPVDAQPPRAS